MPPEIEFHKNSDLDTVVYPTSSDSTLSPHFTTDRGILLPGEDSAWYEIKDEDDDGYRLPSCGIIPLCRGIYSAIRNPIYGVSPRDVDWARRSCISTLNEIITSYMKLADIAVLIIKDHFPSGLPVSVGYLPPSVDAALRQDEPLEWPEPLPRESDKGSALVKLRGIFEAIAYLLLTNELLVREEEEIVFVARVAIGGTILNAHFTAIEDPRFQMRIGLIKKWLRGRQAEFWRVVDEIGWLFERSRDEIGRVHAGRDYGGGLRQRKVVRRRPYISLRQ